jgi:hypothetical protein
MKKRTKQKKERTVFFKLKKIVEDFVLFFNFKKCQKKIMFIFFFQNVKVRKIRPFIFSCFLKILIVGRRC